MRVCKMCGDKGWAETMVVCSKCQTIVQHVYCLNKMGETDDGEVIWVCELCEPRVTEGSDHADIYCSSDVELLQSSKQSQDTKDTEKPKCPLAQNAENSNSTSTNEAKSLCREREKNHNPVEKLHNILGNKHSPGKISEAFHVESCNSDSQETSSMLKNDFREPAQPLPDSIWMGSFRTYNAYCCTVSEMLAHMSNEACEEASVVASSLPLLLCLEAVPKSNIWPLKFKNMRPTIDNIAVYFFPENYRAERMHDSLVDHIIEHDLAMVAKFNDIELLLFSSRELPLDNWRFQGKYYLWGIFRKKKKTSPEK